MHLADYQGYIVVVDDWQVGFNEPVEYRQYWPTDLLSRNWEQVIGQEVRQLSASYAYECVNTNVGIIHLRDWGKTLPVFIEQRPIEPPKGKKRKTWKHGRWV